MAEAALGDKVVDATNALLVAAVPVLHCGVLDLCVGARAQLHHRSVQLCANQADFNIVWTPGKANIYIAFCKCRSMSWAHGALGPWS